MNACMKNGVLLSFGSNASKGSCFVMGKYVVKYVLVLFIYNFVSDGGFLIGRWIYIIQKYESTIS